MTTRRDFLRTMGLAAAGMAIGGPAVFGAPAKAEKAKPKRPEKVKIAYVGIGNRGEEIIRDSREQAWSMSWLSAM